MVVMDNMHFPIRSWKPRVRNQSLQDAIDHDRVRMVGRENIAMVLSKNIAVIPQSEFQLLLGRDAIEAASTGHLKAKSRNVRKRKTKKRKKE